MKTETLVKALNHFNESAKGVPTDRVIESIGSWNVEELVSCLKNCTSELLTQKRHEVVRQSAIATAKKLEAKIVPLLSGEHKIPSTIEEGTYGYEDEVAVEFKMRNLEVRVECCGPKTWDVSAHDSKRHTVYPRRAFHPNDENAVNKFCTEFLKYNAKPTAEHARFIKVARGGRRCKGKMVRRYV